MITTLNLEIIEYIVSFISHEMVIVLFPKRSEKNIIHLYMVMNGLSERKKYFIDLLSIG